MPLTKCDHFGQDESFARVAKGDGIEVVALNQRHICQRFCGRRKSRMWWTSLVMTTVFAPAIGVSPLFCAPQQDPVSLLEHVRERLTGDLQNLVRHSCVQTIVRTYRRANGAREGSCAGASSPGERPVQWWDRWRLDVAIAGREIYSWAGAPQFGEGKLTDFIDYGGFTNGDFGPLISGAIVGSASTIYKDERVIDGRKLLEYTYDVPSFRSRYYFETDIGPVPVAYEGALLIDPVSADLVRLTARTAVLPNGAVACQAISSVDYARTRIGQYDALIPSHTEVHMSDRLGGEISIVISYASCRQYQSQSVIRFEEHEEQLQKSGDNGSKMIPMPEGLAFRCRIFTPLRSETSAAGDVIEAKLRSPIIGKDGTVLAPVGARILGRLVRVLRSASFYEIRVRLESIEISGKAVPLWASQTRLVPGSLVSTGIGAFVPKGTGVFLFREKNLRVRYIDSEWTTLMPQP